MVIIGESQSALVRKQEAVGSSAILHFNLGAVLNSSPGAISNELIQIILIPDVLRKTLRPPSGHRKGGACKRFLLPFVGSRHQIKVRSRFRLTDAPQLDHDAEKFRVFTSSLVKPIQSLPVFVSELPRQPHYDVSVITRGVCEQLAKMVVISRLELVLYYDRPILVQVGCQHVQRIAANGRFCFL